MLVFAKSRVFTVAKVPGFAGGQRPLGNCVVLMLDGLRRYGSKSNRD